jgi:hypothetical protein
MPSAGESMMTEAHFGERVASMETELKYIKRDMDELKGDVADIKDKQDQMITLLTEANGMRKLIRWLWVVAVAGAGIVWYNWTTFKGLLMKIGG